jgi:CDP-diacylglycerol--serine O-phosphatidyltransferase
MRTLTRRRAPFAFFHPSNLLTYLSVTFAWAAVVQGAGRGSDRLVGGCLILAAVCDMLDGRFARFSERWFARDASHRSFGVQIDSLADAVAFGAAPATLALLRVPSDPIFATALIIVALVYLLCVLTRLGQFNVAILERWEGASARFIGLPTTYAGLVWGLWFAFSGRSSPGYGVFLGLGLLMVSPIPIPRPRESLFWAIVTAGFALGGGLLWFGTHG